MFLGTENLVEMAKRVKMKVSLSPLPSLPLGTQEINIIDLLGGYSVLANEGYTIEPHLINRVEDIHGHLLYKHEYDSELVLNKNYTYIINDLMSGCYDYNLIDYNYPTCISMAPKITKNMR